MSQDVCCFFFSSRRRHTRFDCDWSSHVCSSDLCGEKAKTRYLGDLIARRQMDPRVVLNRDIKEFWENIGRLRSSRVPLGAPGTRKTEREIGRASCRERV